jgi:3-mercaptopyruvate sulfurtransferase SseA
VAQELQRAGWPKARAITGGWQGWRAAGLPVAPKPVAT